MALNTPCERVSGGKITFNITYRKSMSKTKVPYRIACTLPWSIYFCIQYGWLPFMVLASDTENFVMHMQCYVRI